MKNRAIVCAGGVRQRRHGVRLRQYRLEASLGGALWGAYQACSKRPGTGLLPA